MSEELAGKGNAKHRRSFKNSLVQGNQKNLRVGQSPQPCSYLEQVASANSNILLQQKHLLDQNMKKQNISMKIEEQDQVKASSKLTSMSNNDVDMHVYYNGVKGTFAPMVMTSPKNHSVVPMNFIQERNNNRLNEEQMLKMQKQQMLSEGKKDSREVQSPPLQMEPGYINKKSDKKIIMRINKSQQRGQSTTNTKDVKMAGQVETQEEALRGMGLIPNGQMNWQFPNIMKGSIQQEQANQNKESKMQNIQMRSVSKEKNRQSHIGAFASNFDHQEQLKPSKQIPFMTNIPSSYPAYQETLNDELSVIDNEALQENNFSQPVGRMRESKDIFRDEYGDECYYQFEDDQDGQQDSFIDDIMEREEANELAMKQEEEQEQDSPQTQKKKRLFRQMEEDSPIVSEVKKQKKEYSIQKVVQQMLLRKDRKIPGSVLKEHSKEVIIVQTAFLGQITPFQRFFFPYPKYCFKNNSAESFIDLRSNIQEYLNRNTKNQPFKNMEIFKASHIELEFEYKDPGFIIADSTHIYNSVVNTLKTAGFRILSPSSDKWNVMWTGLVKPDFLRECNRFQRLNHFPNSFHLGRKDLMWKNLQRMKLKFTQDYDICPETYLLPLDYKRLQADRDNEGQRALYIIKPNASSCGKGIRVLGPGDQVPKKQGNLVSKYVSNPHLIDGLKYDLRIYVLVTSFDPLKVYLFKEGLVRFATERYSTNIQQLKKRFVHLTNYSVNKKAEGYVKNQDNLGQEEADDSSSKWNLHQLARHFQKVGIDYKAVRDRIKDVIIKTLVSVEPHIVNAMSRCSPSTGSCFEIYGFDILLDQRLKPWLLEVNISPSLSSSSPLDKKIKTVLICDSLNLVGVQPYDRVKEERLIEEAAKNKLMGLEKARESLKPQGQVQFNQLFKVLAKNDKNQSAQISQEETALLVEFEEEQHRKANFDLIFPLASNFNYYSRFFDTPRSNNDLLWKYVKQTHDSGKKAK